MLHTLASTHRRRILDIVSRAPGITVGWLATHFDITRIASDEPPRGLERAGLLVSRRQSTARELFFNAVAIEALSARWTIITGSVWARHLLGIKAVVEQSAGAPGDA